MPGDFIVIPDLKLICSYGWATVTFQEIVDHRARLAQEAPFATDFKRLTNLSDADEVSLSGEQIRTLAQQYTFLQCRRALTVGSPLHFGMSRMFHAYSETPNLGIFKRLEDAVHWLDVPLQVVTDTFAELRRRHAL